MHNKLSFFRRISISFGCRSIILVSLICLLAGFSVSCMKKPPPLPKELPVQTIELKAENIEKTTEYVSTIFSRKSANIQPRISGPIVQIFIKDGDYVKKGQPLLTIESSQQAASVASAQSSSVTALNNIQQARAGLKTYYAEKEAKVSSLELAKLNYNRTKALYDQGSETKYNLDEAYNNLNQAKANLKTTDEEINTQKELIKAQQSTYAQSIDETEQQQALLGYYTITAPFNGYAGHIPVKIGDYVTPSTLLTTVTENQRLEVKVDVDVSLKNKLKKGMKIRIMGDNEEDIADGEIYFISSVIDQNSQTVQVDAFIDNTKGIFDTGQVVKVKIVWCCELNIAIPTESVMHYSGKDFVFITNKTKDGLIANQIPVDLGDIINNNYIVESGLKAGDNLIVSGIQKLKDGSPVRILDDSKKNEH